MSPAVRQLFYDLQEDLDRISARFRNARVTLVVRAPDLEDGDVVVGNDNLDAAISAINRLKMRPPTWEPEKL